MLVLINARESVGESCKKRRVKKVQARLSFTFKQDHPFISRSHKRDEYAKRNSCRIDISVARGGKNDVTKHVTSENHKISVAAEKEIEG